MKVDMKRNKQFANACELQLGSGHVTTTIASVSTRICAAEGAMQRWSSMKRFCYKFVPEKQEIYAIILLDITDLRWTIQGK